MYSITVAATLDFMLSRIGPISPILLQVDHFGPINNIIESATGIKKYITLEVNRIPLGSRKKSYFF